MKSRKIQLAKRRQWQILLYSCAGLSLVSLCLGFLTAAHWRYLNGFISALGLFAVWICKARLEVPDRSTHDCAAAGRDSVHNPRTDL